jgi:radical SAM superfamily enzyme YgiQ (UPF0313 family)
MTKIALINPPQDTQYPQPPLGLALIAAILEKAGYQVTLIEANALKLGPATVVEMAADADIVGITAMTPTIGTALNITGHLKKRRPDLKIILGGPHATLLPEETMASSPDVDIIVRGEGDETAVELLKALEGSHPIDNIAGITYRKDGIIVNSPDRISMVDMDSLPYPAYHLLPWQKYHPHPPHGMAMPFGALVTSRGCPYRCAYCSKPVFGSKFRAQSPDRVVEEIVYLKQKFGVKEIAFYDDTFTIDKDRVHAIADKIVAKKLKIAWTCETRVNLVDKELLAHMKRSGCYTVAYGIESASPEIIKTLQKDITLKQVEAAIRAHKEVGLQVVGYFMLGSPGETPETIQQTIDYAKELKVDFAQFSVTTPFPGTELYEIYKRINPGNIDWEKFIYAGTDNPTNPVFESDKLTREALVKWTARAYREFYLRPSYVWQRLQRCTSWGEIKMNFKGLSMLLRSI